MMGLSFLQLGFLAALGALAVPIVLHLMSRDVPRRVVFPTIRFIMKGQRLQAGRRGLRDLLTLLCRLLILAAIVLLFAGPYLERAVAPTVDAAPEIVVFVDTSFSMRAIDDHKSYLGERLDEIFTAHPQGKVAVLLSSNRLEKVLPLSDDRAAVRELINGLTIRQVAGDHYAALGELDRVFSKAETRKIVYVISDLQRRDWSLDKLPALGLDAEFEFMRPPHSGGDNLAIMRVFPELFTKEDSKRLRATVQVRNFALSPARARLSIRAGEQEVSRDIELKGEFSEKFVFELENPTSAEAVAELQASEALNDDNQYRFWAGEQAPFRVAVVADAQSDPRKAIELFFARNALSVHFPGLDKIEASVVTPDFVWQQSLGDFHCIFLLDALASYSTVEMEQFKTYLNEGGVVVVFAGTRTADGFAQLNAGELTTTRFQGYIGELNQLQSFYVEQISSVFPVVSVFEREPADIRSFPIFRMVRFRPASDAAVLLATDDGHPLLLQESVGSGVLFTFAVGLSPQWSEFPTSMAFLPLMRRIVEYSGGQRKRGVAELTVGAVDPEQLVAAGLDPVAQLPDEPAVLLVDKVPVELNYSRLESDLRAVEPFAISDHLRQGKPAVEDANDKPSLSSRRMLHSAVAMALLAFLFLELICANHRLRTQ